MQMLGDKPLAEQPVPPDVWLWNALVPSLHVRRPKPNLQTLVYEIKSLLIEELHREKNEFVLNLYTGNFNPAGRGCRSASP